MTRLEGGSWIDYMAGGDGDDVYVVNDILDQVKEFPNEGQLDQRNLLR